MKRSDWQEIRSAIYDALSDYDCYVYYNHPTDDGQCGYFAITINEDYDEDDVDNCLSDVMEEYNLWIDDEVEDDEDLDLCASWDD